MYVPQLPNYPEKTRNLREKSWKIGRCSNSYLNSLLHKCLSLEGRTSGIKSPHSIKNLKEKIRLPSGGDYNSRELIEEQLTLIENTNSDPELYKFARFLSKQENALQKLGMLLFGLDHFPDKLAQGRDENLLEEIFSSAVNLIDKRLNDAVNRNKKTGIQSSKIVKSTLIPQEIAKLVITDKGFVNAGLLEWVKEAIAKKRKTYLSHDVSLLQTLTLFLQSKLLREHLENIKAPINSQSPAGVVIRASLGMVPDSPIRKVHAIRTVVAALLSHLRQQEKRSCFATFLAINMKQSHLKMCIDDFNSLLQYSHLTREEDGVTQHFPFLLKMSNLDLNHELNFDRHGKIDGAGFLLDSAGISAACKVMGFDNPKETLKQVVRTMNSPATPKKIIEKLATLGAKSSIQRKTAAKLYQEGCFAFGSATFNPLLKVWVNAIAGMAESQASCFFGSCILKTIMTVFHKHLVKDSSLEFEKQLYFTLYETIQLIYDPSLGSSEGGFVLYAGEDCGEFRQLNRIDNAKDFKRFISRILNTLANNPKNKDLAESLQSYVNSLQFTETLLTSYNEILFHHLDKTDQKTRSAPWINLLGHDASDILKVYLSDSKELKTQVFIPKNGKSLLRRLIIMGKSLDETEKNKLKQNPYLLKPARILNYHAFSLMIGFPALQKAWRDKRPSRKWIEEEIFLHGSEVSDAPISDEQRRLLIKNLRIADLPQKATIKEFRKSLLKKLYPFAPGTELEVDRLIVETLPKNLKDKLGKTVIHFADTNLHSGVHDIHFCFIVNPGTGKIEVWQATDDNSTLIPLDQNLVVKNQQWQIYLYPDGLIK